jgi:hypothetical protein
VKAFLIWPALPCALLTWSVWTWAGLFGDPISWAAALSVSIGACGVAARDLLSGARARWAVMIGACLGVVAMSYGGLRTGIALFPWHVQRHLAEYEQIAEEARSALESSREAKLSFSGPRWDLTRATAQRQASGRIEVILFFRGSGRRTIVNGEPERHVEGEGSCLVEFAPKWFWHRPCPAAPPAVRRL